MNQNISTVGMTREEWLQKRQGGIGGSDAAAILGLNPFKTSLDVYNDKTAEMIEEISSPKMKAGLRMESVIADWYGDETGFTIQHDYKMRKHPLYPILIADMDRLIVGQDLGPGVLECKNTSSYYKKHWEHEIPLIYFCQEQHYFGVTGYKWGEIAMLVDGWEFDHFPLTPMAQYISDTQEVLLEWWENHIVKGVPPPAMTEADLKKLHPMSVEGMKIETTAEVMEMIQQHSALRSEEKESKTLKEDVAFQIKRAMGDAEILTFDDEVVATFKTGKDKSYFDKAQLKIDDPKIYIKYDKTVPGNRPFLNKIK